MSEFNEHGFRYDFTDCEVHYSAKNPSNQTVFYCLQLDHTDKFKLLRCCRDREPSYEVCCRAGVLPLPPDDGNSLNVAAREFLNNMKGAS